MRRAIGLRAETQRTPFEDLDVLVTGGSGFIGSRLCTLLAGHSARVCNIDPRRPDSRVGSYVMAEGTDREVLKDHIESKSAIFHLAGRADVKASFENPINYALANVNGTINLLETARKWNDNAPILLVSTSSVYGETAKHLKKETDSLLPLTPYSASKVAAEVYAGMYARKYGLKIVVVRLFNTYGSIRENRGDVVSQFINAVIRRKPPTVFGSGNQVRDLTYVDDVVKMMEILLASKDAHGKILNLGTGRGTSMKRLAQLVIEIFGEQKGMTPRFQLDADGGPSGNVSDNTLLMQTVGLVPETTIRVGLQTMRLAFPAISRL